MKELSYTRNGKEYNFVYETKCDIGEYGESHWTDFYSPEPIKYKIRKYLFFGPLIEKTKYKKVFQIVFNVEDPRYTKLEVRKELNRRIDLMNRKSEIERGEIV